MKRGAKEGASRPASVAMLFYPDSDDVAFWQYNPNSPILDVKKKYYTTYCQMKIMEKMHNLGLTGFMAYHEPIIAKAVRGKHVNKHNNPQITKHRIRKIIKKGHVHLEVVRPPRCGYSMKTWKIIANYLGAANSHVEVLVCPHEYAKYLLHSREKDKSKKPVPNRNLLIVGDLDYYEYIKIEDAFEYVVTDTDEILNNILDYIECTRETSFAKLVNYVRKEVPTAFSVLKSNTNFIKTYQRSIEYENNQENRLMEALATSQQKQAEYWKNRAKQEHEFAKACEYDTKEAISKLMTISPADIIF